MFGPHGSEDGVLAAQPFARSINRSASSRRAEIRGEPVAGLAAGWACDEHGPRHGCTRAIAALHLPTVSNRSPLEREAALHAPDLKIAAHI